MKRVTTRTSDSPRTIICCNYFNLTKYSHISLCDIFISFVACSLSNTDDSNLGKRKRDQQKEDEILMDIDGIVEEASCDLEEYSFKVRSK